MTDPSSPLPTRFLRNLLSNYAARFVGIGIAFLMTPFVLGKLGAGAFGAWVLVTSVVGYGGLLDLGLSGALVKYVAELRAREDYEGANRLIATVLSLYTALGALFGLISVGLAYAVPRLFDVSPTHRDELPWVILVAGLGIGAALPCTASTGVLRAIHRFDVTNALGIAGAVGSALAIIVLLSLGGGLLALATVTAVTPLLLQIPALVAARRIEPRLEIGWSRASRQELARLVSFSSPVSAIQLSGFLTARTDPIVVGAFLRVSSITPYALGQRLSQLVYSLTTEVVKVLFPFASERNAHGDTAALRTIFLAGSRVTLAVSVPLTLYLTVFGPALLTVWVGAEYAEYGYIVAILAANFMLDTASYPGTGVLMAIDRHRPIAWMALTDGLLNLVLSIALVHPLGLRGVALATLLSTILVLTFLIIPYTTRTLATSYGEVLRAVALPFVLPAAAYLGALLLLRSFFGTTSFPAAIMGLAAAALYAALYVRFGATPGERHVYRQYAEHAKHLLIRRRR